MKITVHPALLWLLLGQIRSSSELLRVTLSKRNVKVGKVRSKSAA